MSEFDEDTVERMIEDKVDHLRKVAAGLERGLAEADDAEALAALAREGKIECTKARNTLNTAVLEAEKCARDADDTDD